MNILHQRLLALLSDFESLRITNQIDYDKFYLYSIITHSTAIEGSTVTEVENQVLFDDGISIKGRSIAEQMMNLDLKKAYERALLLAQEKTPITTAMLCELSAIVMKNTGSEYNTALGSFSSSNGDIRLLNVTAGVGGSSYMDYHKVPDALNTFCSELQKSFEKVLLSSSVIDKYILSFDAHYNLVTIHPWADGNGRMSRLLMNYLQVCLDVIPSIINKDNKAEYINALIATRESGDNEYFRNFMLSEQIDNLSARIDSYKKSLSVPESREKISKSREKTQKSREKILSLISENSSITTSQLAESISISSKAVEKHLANLKADGLLKRIGPDKGGYWEVVKTSLK